MTLYKYLAPNLQKILSSQEIRFTQPEFFNDPFESFPFIQQLMTEARFDDFIISKLPDYITDKFIEENITTLMKNNPWLDSNEKLITENKIEIINRVKLQIPDFISLVKKEFTKSSNDEWLKLSTKKRASK